MKKLKFIFSRPNILFALSLLIGLLFPQAVSISVFLILPALILIMTITPLKIQSGFFRRPKKLITPALYGNILNYLLLCNLIIFSGIIFTREEGFFRGMVLIAAVPPAVSMLSLNKLLRGDSTFSMAGFAGAYLGALVLIPLIGLSFLKYIEINYWFILLIVFSLILLPLIISRIIVEKEWDKMIEPREGLITDCCFFIVFYSIAAQCSNLISDWSYDMSVIPIIAAVILPATYFAIKKIGRAINAAESKITSAILLGTLKNYGLAGGIAILLFPPQAAFAALAFAAVNIIYTNWLSYPRVAAGKKTGKKKA
jgi:BASS family bile acid:Na+ symporter